MTVETRDIPETEKTETLAHRLKRARTVADLTRKELAKRTGIPMKSVEKFESGAMDPNTKRLRKLAEVLEVSPEHLLYGGDQATASQMPALSDDPTIDVPTIEEVEDALTRIDDLREGDFSEAKRPALALAQTANQKAASLDADDLLELAEHRRLFAADLPTVSDLEKASIKDPEQAESAHQEIANRIVDTAIFGIDLYALELEPVADLAQEIGVEMPLFFGWDSHHDMLEDARSHLRRAAIILQTDLADDRKRFPLRKVKK